MLLYHGPQPERAKLLKQIRRPQGPLGMCPVVVTSFEISMIDRKFLQVGSPLARLESNRSQVQKGLWFLDYRWMNVQERVLRLKSSS